MPSACRPVLIAILLAGAHTAAGQSAPAIFPRGVVNAAGSADPSAPVSAGSIVSIYGSHLASNAPGGGDQAAAFPLPANLGGARVLMNGVAAPLYYANSAQINAQVPWEVRGASVLQGQVLYAGAVSNTVSATLSAIAPGIFVAVHALDYSPVTSSQPRCPVST